MLKKARFISLAVLGSLTLICSTAFSSPDHAQSFHPKQDTCDGKTATIEEHVQLLPQSFDLIH